MDKKTFNSFQSEISVFKSVLRRSVDRVTASKNEIEAFAGSLARRARASFTLLIKQTPAVHARMFWHHLLHRAT